MVDKTKSVETKTEPQCQHFVARKKRLCRMTVRPGREYCGEHDPQPKTEDGNNDERIPCPNDPKHTCYVSKLAKHLAVCNARPSELPPYLELNINAPDAAQEYVRRPLAQIPRELLMALIDKVCYLYDKHVKDNITAVPQRPIHMSMVEKYNEPERKESSLRHLRQASQLLCLAEDTGLVQEGTCYVELGAGKGELSYYAGVSWCGADSAVLAVDRASLRHKRDNRLRARSERLRADLAHLALDRVPCVRASRAVLGLAKHLCGVATDYALRCITGAGVLHKCRGVVLATCCHHRCEQHAYVANAHLQELGISGEELNMMLGIVSWATCGDGRSRDTRKLMQHTALNDLPTEHDTGSDGEQISNSDGEKISNSYGEKIYNSDDEKISNSYGEKMSNSDGEIMSNSDGEKMTNSDCEHTILDYESCRKVLEGPKDQVLSQEFREQVGRKAKALLDWGRVLYLRGKGFDAGLRYYVPRLVSLENVCIVANKLERTQEVLS